MYLIIYTIYLYCLYKYKYHYTKTTRTIRFNGPGFNVQHISLQMDASSLKVYNIFPHMDLGCDFEILSIPPSGSNASLTKHSQEQTTHIHIPKSLKLIGHQLSMSMNKLQNSSFASSGHQQIVKVLITSTTYICTIWRRLAISGRVHLLKALEENYVDDCRCTRIV